MFAASEHGSSYEPLALLRLQGEGGFALTPHFGCGTMRMYGFGAFQPCG